MDEEYNLGWARCFASGEWPSPFDALRGEPYFRAPLYSYFVAGLLLLFQGDTLLVRGFQMLLGAISCALAYALATRCFGRRTGVVTGMLCAVYWVLIYFDGEFLLPVLLVFLLLSAFNLVHAAITRRNAWLAGAGGLTFGLYAITRPNILLFLPLLVVWTWLLGRRWPRRLAWAFLAAMVCGASLPPAVVTLRNRIVGHDWVLIASQGGMNFFIGNNPESNGMQAIVPGTRSTWWGGYEDVVSIAEEARGRRLRPSEVSSYWYGRGFAYIREHPGEWLRLLGQKVLAWIGDVEVPNNEAYGVRRREYRALSIPLGFGVLFAGFLVSLPSQLRMARRARGGGDPEEAARGALVVLMLQFLLAYTLSFLAFFVTGRYRVALVPILAMGAAMTGVQVFDAFRRREILRGAASVVAVALLALLLHADVLEVRASAESFAAYNRAVEQLDLGKLDEGIATLERLMDSDTVYEPEFYGTLIRAYDRRGRPQDRSEIALVAEYALQFYPANPDLLWWAASARRTRHE
jgi:4-amino-4-deoxy-L-arabinose transferase-like glycosyltransferase